ncbi:MAG: DUF3303 family protein [candidate division Zixibacteria bacterium]|nr:DUF3303 family protein [candidate division Zixibacteria bacterium]
MSKWFDDTHHLKKGRPMKYLVKFSWPIESGNATLKDPQFGSKMKQLLSDLKAEAAYFAAVDGGRGGYIVLNMEDASQIPAVAEPLFQWLHAAVEFIPVMLPQDLEKAGPAIAASIKKWA